MSLDRLKINLNYALRRTGIGINGFFTETYHTNDGPLESLSARSDTVTANVNYNNKRRAVLREARKRGLEGKSYSTYRQSAKEGMAAIDHPGNKVWADIFAPNRSGQ